MVALSVLVKFLLLLLFFSEQGGAVMVVSAVVAEAMGFFCVSHCIPDHVVVAKEHFIAVARLEGLTMLHGLDVER